ncbi:cyclin-dependent kinase 4-like [Oratosquilla oratoria]|uniref:cyclin-dependent kinase 4-like n=1 Tax=Oratosquilla oratoria TaxID=337810 RepID=UPI003F7679FB
MTMASSGDAAAATTGSGGGRAVAGGGNGGAEGEVVRTSRTTSSPREEEEDADVPPRVSLPPEPSSSASTTAATQAAAAQAAMNAVAELPRAADNYVDMHEVGNGAYGTVYRARDLSNDGRFVALKRLRVALNDDGVPVTTVREIAVLRSLERYEHPNIVRLLDICHGRMDRDQLLNLMLVFEYVEMDLERYIRECPPPGLEPARIKSLMRQILNGVDFLHTNRIIHRDLKPQNLLVNHRGQLKIADFGLARIYDFNMRLTTLVVTLYYRAPEVLLSNTYATPVDIWSCGCIFAEMYRRTPLFPGNTEGDQLQRIFDVIGTPRETDWPQDVSLARNNFREHKGRPLQDVIPEITSDAIDLLQRMLCFLPDIRVSAGQALDHSYFRTHDENNENNPNVGNNATTTTSTHGSTNTHTSSQAALPKSAERVMTTSNSTVPTTSSTFSMATTSSSTTTTTTATSPLSSNNQRTQTAATTAAAITNQSGHDSTC